MSSLRRVDEVVCVSVSVIQGEIGCVLLRLALVVTFVFLSSEPTLAVCNSENCSGFCCNGHCCSSSSTCCDGHCCSGKCCGGTCCSSSAKCCGSLCCSAGSSCCGSYCCPEGQQCCNGGCCSGNCVSDGQGGEMCCGADQTGCVGNCCDYFCCDDDGDHIYDDCPACSYYIPSYPAFPMCRSCDNDIPADGIVDGCRMCDVDQNGNFTECYVCDSNDDCVLDTCDRPCNNGLYDTCYTCNNDGDSCNDDCPHNCNGVSKCYDCDLNCDQTMDSCLVATPTYQDLQACPGTRQQKCNLDYDIDGCSVPEWAQGLVVDRDNPCGIEDVTDFGDCCKAHDEHYQTCDYDKDLADNILYWCMRYVCEDANDPVCGDDDDDAIHCMFWVNTYYQAVHLGGDSIYEGRQLEYCTCCF
jgi:hypothetical protein